MTHPPSVSNSVFAFQHCCVSSFSDLPVTFSLTELIIFCVDEKKIEGLGAFFQCTSGKIKSKVEKNCQH